MQYGIDLAPLGEFADPQAAVQLAEAAEAAGWDGFFVWDHWGFIWDGACGEAWVMLSAVAQATERLRLGPAITPVARRRPQVLAHSTATLDALSEGRLIFGAGLGNPPDEFAAFGEAAEAKQRAEKLDEGLEVIAALWSGEAVTYQGAHFSVKNVTLAPLPLQEPRIPVWIGGDSPPALRRAAQWDGWIIDVHGMEGEVTHTPEKLKEQVAYIQVQRGSEEPFEVAIIGISEAGETEFIQAYEQAGATWWLESIYAFRGGLAEMMARVEAGPPE